MLRRLSLALSLFVAFAVSASPVGAAAASHVKASLVSADASVQPGRPVTVALRLQHAPHWHTYWVNPGTGLPTKLDWSLPAGWKAGEPQWPAPVLLKDKSGGVIGNGYEGEVLVPVTLTPPADLPPGGRVELKLSVSWLECEEVCVPGEANLALGLPVSAEPPKPDPNFGDPIRAAVANLPQADANWKISASRAGKNITLSVAPAAATASHPPQDLHFFADNNLVGYDLPQQAQPDGQGGFTLKLLASDDGPKDAKHLTGVLVSTNGWRPGGALRGLRVDAPFTVAAAPLDATTVLLALLGGLILNLMPCVFPVLGLKILGFVHQAGQERGKIVAHGLIFTLGVLLSFWTLAGILAILRGSGHQLGWGFQLQEPGFVFALAALLLVFAMNMSGVFEFGLRATTVGAGLQMKSGLSGSFFTGVLATVVATPCSAPILAPALGAALAVPTAQSFLLFTAIGIGLSLPYLLLSAFPAAVKLLPRPGAWMETFKQFMAFPLYATVGVLVWVLSGQAPDETLLAVMGLVVIALGVWIYGRWHAPGGSLARARFGTAALVVLLLGGGWLGWPKLSPLVWEPWSPEAVAKLRAEGRIIYVDFTAKWCFTCQTNKAAVFHSKEVLSYFADKKIATLRGDWTARDPRITAELARYNRAAVPFNVIWMPGKEEPIILPETLFPQTVLSALKENAPAPQADVKRVTLQSAPGAPTLPPKN